MRQQDRDRLEERIVAYFEGTLNDDASRALAVDGGGLVAQSRSMRELIDVVKIGRAHV